jgi:phytoene/squalene synthetase
MFSARLLPFSLSAAHYENFPVASLALPRRLRADVLAIYRFARMADDVADEGDAAAAERLAALDRIGRALDAAAAGNPPPEPPFPELAATIARRALPVELFHDLLSAFRQDVTAGRYPTYADVLDYCRRTRSAGCCSICTGRQRPRAARIPMRSAPRCSS